MKNLHPVKKWLQDRNISEVEIFVPDLSGVARGKILPCEKFMLDPVRIPVSALAQTITGDWGKQEDFLDDKDGDMELHPDINGCFPVPWANEPTGQIICDSVSTSGRMIRWAPRSILKRVLRAYQQKGWQPIVAPEVEFYLASRDNNPDNPLCPPVGRTGRPGYSKQPFNIDAVNEFEEIIEDIYRFAEAEELAVDTLVHEEGVAQFEINFKHGDALTMADQVMMFKRCVREAAIRHKMVATFMAKPMGNQPGSALHLHQSLTSRASGENLFADKNGKFSKMFTRYIAGLQHYAAECTAIYAPNINSFRRIDAPWATSNVQWGVNNRTVGFRVPTAKKPADTRVENRLFGADVNPYLAFAASLLSGFLGIQQRLSPSAMVSGGAWELPRGLPSGPDEALQQMNRSKMLREHMGNRFVDLYVGCKKTEIKNYQRVVSSWERKFLLDI